MLDDGRELPSAVTIWTAGFGVPELAAGSGLRTDAMGRLLTDETLTSIDDPRIVAAGDAAAPSGEPLRMSCQAAHPAGRPGRQHRAEPHRRHRARGDNQAFTGQCISLGRNAGTIQLAHTDDTAVAVYIGGRAGRGDQGGRSARAPSRACRARPASPARTSGSRAASGAQRLAAVQVPVP